MVSLEKQTVFFQRLNESPLQPLIDELHSNQIGRYTDESINATDLALNLLIATKSSNREQAEKYYAVFCKRQPSKDSHWIYDNYVLFCIVVVVVKFRFDSIWVSNVLNLSLAGANTIDSCIRETFRNLLAGNFNARNDYHQISMVYQFISKDEHYQENHVNKLFHELWLKPFPFYGDDFLDLMSLKAIEVAVVKKSLLSYQEQYYLRQFIPAFNRKADFVSNFLSWLIVITLIACIGYGLFKINAIEADFPVFVKSLFFFIGISGAGLLSFVGWKKWFAKAVRKMIDLFFQYKQF